MHFQFVRRGHHIRSFDHPLRSADGTNTPSTAE
jgi:hypothetical protein